MTRVLYWEDSESWLRPLEELIPEATSDDVAAEIRRQPPEYLVSDDLSWLNRVVALQGGSDFDAQSVLSERLLSAFTHLRAYHGCRPNERANYHEIGIVPLDVNRACNSVREIFNSSKFPELTPAIVDNAIASMPTRDREGRIFFEANNRFLLEQCGHYLLYGSEYLGGIARLLSDATSNGRDYVLELRTIGTPTLLECNVPISWLSRGTVCALAGSILVAYFKLLLIPQHRHPMVGEGFGFEIFQVLPPNCIDSVSHPENVSDPIRRQG
jgi:hypothetical protein